MSSGFKNVICNVRLVALSRPSVQSRLLGMHPADILITLLQLERPSQLKKIHHTIYTTPQLMDMQTFFKLRKNATLTSFGEVKSGFWKSVGPPKLPLNMRIGLSTIRGPINNYESISSTYNLSNQNMVRLSGGPILLLQRALQINVYQFQQARRFLQQSDNF